MKIDVKRLRRDFGRIEAVKDISFSFETGQIFGFIGPNGSGKTTTLRILATLDLPTSGDAFIDDSSITLYPEKNRHHIGFVPDSLPLHRDISVHEYVDFFARAYGLRGRERTRSVAHIEDFTGLSHLRERMINKLSKGMKQRVSLARALVHNPSVLLMDEPASGLDPRARIELRELLKILCEQKKAVLISSHILTELTEICNGVVIIETGSIVDTGMIEDITRKSRQHITLLIRTLTDQETLVRDCLEMPGVMDIRKSHKRIAVDFKGDDAGCSEFLKLLIEKGHRIAEFSHEQDSLEDLFMRMTKGDVQ